MSDTPIETNDDRDERSIRDAEDPDISPSVRRLLRQYDVDVRTVRGSGPNGRIRPQDVLAIVGNPSLVQHVGSNVQEAPLRDKADKIAPAVIEPSAAKDSGTHAPSGNAFIGTTLFTCNLSRVLADRSRAGGDGVSFACYVAHAAMRALAEPGLGPGVETAARLSIVGADSESTAASLTPENSLSPADVGAALARAQTAEVAALRIVHHGLPGHVIDLVAPVADGELAVLSVGGLQRGIGLGILDGSDAPRVIVQCQLALSFRSDAVDATDAARFVGACVHTLENWPLPDAAATSGG